MFLLLLKLCASDEENVNLQNGTIFDQNQNSTLNEEMIHSKDNSSSEEESGDEMTLRDLEINMKKVLEGMFERVFTLVLGGGLPPKASTKCLLNLARIYFGLNKLEPWAFRSK